MNNNDNFLIFFPFLGEALLGKCISEAEVEVGWRGVALRRHALRMWKRGKSSQRRRLCAGGCGGEEEALGGGAAPRDRATDGESWRGRPCGGGSAMCGTPSSSEDETAPKATGGTGGATGVRCPTDAQEGVAGTWTGAYQPGATGRISTRGRRSEATRQMDMLMEP